MTFSHGFLVAVVLSVVSASVGRDSTAKDFQVKSTGQCGAALEGDNGLIVYSGPSGTVEKDELCIWTVHLLTTSTIKLNISDADFNGGDASCGSGALRTYSLTNLVQGDNMESYMVCPENQGADQVLFLSDNAMVVTFRTSNSSSQGGKGFTLSWEGIKHASPQISHASSISTLQDGIIRYPVRGEYAANTLSTWLVNLNRQSSVPSLDVNILKLDVETCSPGVPDTTCFCDAVVVYEITGDGKLKEIRRFCGQLGFPVTLNPSQLNFLVAFYSDGNNQPGVGTGLELIWSGPEVPTEPTTRPTTTPTGPTTPSPDVISTTCSGILDILQYQTGRISYSNVQIVAGNDEICTWTIRTNGSPNITLELDYFETDSEDGNELDVHFHNIAPNRENPMSRIAINQTTDGEILLPGPLAVVTFHSKSNRAVGSSAKFQLWIRRVESSDGTPEYPVTSNYTDLLFDTSAGSVRYPDTPPYSPNELTTVLVNPKESNGSAYVVFKFDIVDMDSCFDPVNVYVLENRQFVFKKTMCDADYVTEFIASNVVLVVFSSGAAYHGDGFEANWYTKFPGPSTTCGGVIDLSLDVGAIDYIETATDRDNEQCVWTVRATTSRLITFQLVDYDVEGCSVGNSLYATGFTGNYSIGGSLRTEMKAMVDCNGGEGQNEVSIQGPVGFLVFKRNQGVLKMNILHEPNLNEIEYPYLSNYTDKAGTQENGTLRYPGPAGWPKFNPFEWGTFVVNPLDRNTTSRIAVKFTILNLGQDGSCWSANVMTYDLRDGLVFQQMLCGGQTNHPEIPGDRTIVVLLRTGTPWTSYATTVGFNWGPRDQLLLDSQ